ncbi:hypothetical protein SCP_0605490 [Sparassis crispa]|uniref:Peptidase S53 activation domain-containing protein n=1 Tax=Sparassis crispa TaxID=139825 RepID=A0A401GQY0_9APHY|nr:hypothetical protein SCP_0605490 [Sparassis crispa]GBE84570.1 hypothetical protein SCP_0605490 [Sparassis crispa]
MQSIPTGLEQALYDVSTLPCANYRKYLTKEAAEFVSPAAESLAAVNNWLQANNIDAAVLTPAGDWISFSVPVSQETICSIPSSLHSYVRPKAYGAFGRSRVLS